MMPKAKHDCRFICKLFDASELQLLLTFDAMNLKMAEPFKLFDKSTDSISVVAASKALLAARLRHF